MPIRARLSLLAPLGLAIALAACETGMGPVPNPFTGCFDDSCVDRPVLVAGLPPLVAVSSLRSHSCGLTADGEAWCWGDNTYGQLGDGTAQRRDGPVQVAGGLRFTAIAAGSTTSCGLALEGTLHCWGSGTSGAPFQPGPGSCPEGDATCTASPQPVPGGPYTAVAAGVRHTCALDGDGSAWCWGFNFLGETGSPDYGTSTLLPRRVSGTHVFTAVAAGDAYTCALTAEGRAYCWGSANRGELGTTAVSICNSVAGFQNYCSPDPVSVSTTARFKMLSVGFSHACALTADGTALCWGDNGQGQLGTSGYASPSAPVIAQNGLRFATIVASSAVTCGTPVEGPSVCWGLNTYGKLGIGSRLELSAMPLPIAGDRRYVALAAGDVHACGLTADGATWCWGGGLQGQLGAGPRLP